MKITKIRNGLFIMLMLFSCSNNNTSQNDQNDDFNYVLEQFADLRILRYQVPKFDELTLAQKKLVYYLSEAALCGRDILWDQNGKHNLAIRQVLENIYQSYSGNRNAEEYQLFLVYLKRVWFSNCIYHHFSTDKILPDFSIVYFKELIKLSDSEGFPVYTGTTYEETINILIPVIFDSELVAKKVNQSSGVDIVKESAVNFYQGLTQKEVEAFYSSQRNNDELKPLSLGLNSRLIKEQDTIKELVWHAGGLYGGAIEKIIYWLGKALSVAETPDHIEGIKKLIAYYKSGDLKTWDEYNVIWVGDTSHIDFVNGFIETYSDPLGMKATWEAVVNFKDIDATHRTEIIAENAQWFEDNSPVNGRFKKKQVKGVSAKVITVAMLGGDCYPHTPIGINLPNSDWIRKEHGSKSVTMENITYAYSQANLGSGFLEEFSYDANEYNLVKEYGPMTDNLHTDLHECLGHGSGQLLEGVSSEALKNYHSALEETRADLFALYYIMDPRMVELGLLPNADAAKAQYISYMRNGLMTQLRRIEPGNTIEQAHLRNRQLIAKWCYEKGKDRKITERITKEGKTFFRINDFEALRNLVAELLAEVQRIKSEGDYKAGMELVESYAVQVDQELHQEVITRFEKLNIAPYSGFVNPEYELIKEGNDIVDIVVRSVDDFSDQMMKYSKKYSFLPIENN